MRSYFLLFAIAVLVSCSPKQSKEETSPITKIKVIVDTDANNELDDQHALAYLFFSQSFFDVLGVTVNATYNGGDIDGHMAEARRVMQLCDVMAAVPLMKGANDDFESIRSSLDSATYDGYQAVDFIIEKARQFSSEDPLILLPIGKLTNIALALEKAPDIADKVRIVWLGSNYPEKGEYNQDNDIPSLNYILNLNVPFEMVMVRYGRASGSDAVRATPDDIRKNMAGIGPKVEPVEGRHGGTFTNFGDYSINLFEGIDLHGDPPGRALYDMVAVAILKDPSWGETVVMPAPRLVEENWKERPDNPRKIIIWENFDQAKILSDFYTVMKNAGP